MRSERGKGQLTRRDFGGSGQTPLRIDQTYTTRDQVETQTRYSDLSGTTKVASTTYTYDAGLRLTNLQQRNGSGTLLSNTTYTYDAASRLTAETRNGTATTYTYDATNQLTHDGTTTYSYDLNGNRTMPGYTTGTGNRLSSDGTWTFSYDDEGNLTGKTKGAGLETWAYTYDHENHLKSVRQTSNGTTDILRVTYSYDSLGQRVQEDKWKTGVGSATARFVYDGDDVWADLDGTNTLQTRYLRGDNVDEVFARVKSTGAAGWYLTDRLGSVRDVTDASGTVVDHLDYSGFGVVTETNATAGDRYKWTGREYDGDTGLQYNRARYYDGGVGSWLSEDPIGFGGGDGNLRRYVGNGPTNGIDPEGLAEVEFVRIRKDREQDIQIGLRKGELKEDAVDAQANLEATSMIPVIGVPATIVIIGQNVSKGNYWEAVKGVADFIPVGKIWKKGRQLFKKGKPKGTPVVPPNGTKPPVNQGGTKPPSGGDGAPSGGSHGNPPGTGSGHGPGGSGSGSGGGGPGTTPPSTPGGAPAANVLDAVEGRAVSGQSGFLRGTPLTRREQLLLRDELKDLGVTVERGADKVLDKLNPDYGAAFNNKTGTVYLRQGVTDYEAFHEATHARQWAALGRDKYLAQGKYAREKHVFDEIMKNESRFTKDEIKHAKDYIERLKQDFDLGQID